GIASKIPGVSALPGGGFGIDYVVDTFNEQTRDWIVIESVVSVEDHIVARGSFNVPEPNMPRLRASLAEGFARWRAANRCDGNSPSISTARIGFSLVAADGAPAQRPNVSLKYAPGRPMEFRDDRDGVYQGIYDVNAGSINRYTDSTW